MTIRHELSIDPARRVDPPGGLASVAGAAIVLRGLRGIVDRLDREGIDDLIDGLEDAPGPPAGRGRGLPPPETEVRRSAPWPMTGADAAQMPWGLPLPRAARPPAPGGSSRTGRCPAYTREGAAGRLARGWGATRPGVGGSEAGRCLM